MNQYWTREDVSYSGSQFQPNLNYPSEVSLDPLMKEWTLTWLSSLPPTAPNVPPRGSLPTPAPTVDPSRLMRLLLQMPYKIADKRSGRFRRHMRMLSASLPKQDNIQA